MQVKGRSRLPRGRAGRGAGPWGHLPVFQRVGAREEFVKVRKKDLERLTTEVMQIRDFLPRILNGEVLESFQRLKIAEKSECPPLRRPRRWRRPPGTAAGCEAASAGLGRGQAPAAGSLPFGLSSGPCGRGGLPAAAAL